MRCKCCDNKMDVTFREVVLEVDEDDQPLKTKLVLEDMCTSCCGEYMENEDEFGFLDDKDYVFSDITESVVDIDDLEFSDNFD